MARAVARGAAGYDLAALGDEILQCAHVLVIDLERFVGAEPAHLAPPSTGPPPHPAAPPPAAFTAGALGVGARPARARSAAMLEALPCPFFVRHLESCRILSVLMPTAPFAPPRPLPSSLLALPREPHRSVPAGISSIALATTSTPPKTIPDLARLCTGGSAPVTLPVAPAPRHAPSARAVSPVITTSSLNDSWP